MSIASQAQTFTPLVEFNFPDGGGPAAPLVQGVDGNLYGSAYYGGIVNSTCPVGCGVVFNITPAGAMTIPHTFSGADGLNPSALILATDGNFYGTTSSYTASCTGTVFRITQAGTLTRLHCFNGTDGNQPRELIQAIDGNFYGITVFGGTGSCPGGCGTVFQITPDGTLTTLHNFSGYSDGAYPVDG